MKATSLLRSSAFRLALIYMALFCVSVFALLVFLYWTTAGFMVRQTEETVNAEIRGLGEQYRLLGLGGLTHRVRERAAADDARLNLYLLTDWNFSPLAGNIDRWPEAAGNTTEWVEFSMRVQDSEKHHKVRARHLLLEGDIHLLVGRDVSDLGGVQRLIRESMGWGIALTIVLGLVGGVLMTRGMLGRIEAINRASQEIMRGDLSRRIPDKGSADELDRLAQNLNAMLDRIERLMIGIRQVSDNVAHDLRSPLNRLRAKLELALRSGSSPEEYSTVMGQALEDIDGILATFNALLKIARAESGADRENFEELDLTVLTRDMAEFYEPLAEEKGLRFVQKLEQTPAVSGNKHMLSQALANLLDNAVKYTEPGGLVTLELLENHQGVRLVVADSGPGIPSEAREKVLERFYRLESSRNTPGSGLGLSLVSAVARSHRADLRLMENQPGLRVELLFPVAKG